MASLAVQSLACETRRWPRYTIVSLFLCESPFSSFVCELHLLLVVGWYFQEQLLPTEITPHRGQGVPSGIFSLSDCAIWWGTVVALQNDTHHSAEINKN